jgi:hypothetical protein
MRPEQSSLWGQAYSMNIAGTSIRVVHRIEGERGWILAEVEFDAEYSAKT